MYNKIPDIECYMDNNNPTIASPNTPFVIQFYQTKESLANIEDYKAFLDNAIRRFRSSRTYKHYKSFLIGELGMDRCQVFGNITSEMADVEMHHNMITIFDIALIITEHVINTVGKISTFDLVELLAKEHTEHRVCLVMLSKTPHQLYHDDPQFFIPIEMCIGNNFEFLKKYKYGITTDIAYKILLYLKEEEKYEGKINDNNLLKLREFILDWSGLC